MNAMSMMTPRRFAIRVPSSRAALAFAAHCVLVPIVAFAQSDAPAPTGSRVVDIRSNPAGAIVRLDDPSAAPLGVTPLHAVALPEGWHTLYFTRPGYVPYELRAQVTVGILHYDAHLTRAASLHVTADVTGAIVSLDGSDVGETPLDIDGVRPGSHTLEVRGERGTPDHHVVRIRAGASVRVRASLLAPRTTSHGRH